MGQLTKQFGKINVTLPIPHLLNLQIDSYSKFLQEGVAEADRNKEEGLEGVFHTVFPIEDFNKTASLEFVSYEIREPKYDQAECISKGLTYEAPVHIKVRLVVYDTDEATGNRTIRDIKEQGIYFGTLPLMTEKGTFIINGTERVVVSQLVRSPGVYFASERDKTSDKTVYNAKVIPSRGAWLEFETDKRDILSVRIDRKRKQPATLLVRALGLAETREDIIELLGSDEMVLRTLDRDPATTKEESLIELYKRFRPGEPPTIDSARTLLEGLFFNPQRYDLAKVGRYKINKKLGFDEEHDSSTLTEEDIVRTMRYIIGLHNGDEGFVTDDIDHFGNRRIRSVGELIQNQFRIGLSRMERVVRERMSMQEPDEITPQSLVNIRPIVAAIREFFGSSQLSQFMDQSNPAAGITHKRRLSALGPGGLSRERAGFEVRDVHTSHYGRMCPIETPEGPNIGLIGSLATYARVNPYGFIETPYRRVVDGKVTDDVDYLTADEEENYVIAQANALFDPETREFGHRDADGNFIKSTRILCRMKNSAGEFGDPDEVAPELVNYMDVSPRQMTSVATSLIPFLEHDDANRALMGSNMQRQAVPLLKPHAPLVGTGIEHRIAVDSGEILVAQNPGVVDYVDGQTVIVLNNDGEYDEYLVPKFQRSNQSGCINHRPIVRKGDEVQAGDVLADGPSCDGGELALGQNLMVAYMPWEGYNYEDAIIVSERVVAEDLLTSIHISEYEVDARDTKLGPEEITREVPNISEDMLSDLDADGIIRVGAEVFPGDVLVGKVTPKGETELTAEERLLRAIFGEKAREVRDTSLKVPHGAGGRVIGINRFSRAAGDELAPGVNELVRILGMGQSRVSRHLKILTEAGLLTSRRDGLWVFYAATRCGEASDFLQAMGPFLHTDTAMREDLAMAAQILEERALKTRQFFNAIAEDWDELNREVLEDFDLPAAVLAAVPEGCRVAVDLGCGTGAVLERLLPASRSLIGVDGSARMLEMCRRRFNPVDLANENRISLRIGELDHLPLRDQEADFACINLVLHHLSDPGEGLREIRRSLTTGGHLFVADFLQHHDETMRSRYGDRWLGFDEERLQERLRQAGFEVLSCTRQAVGRGLFLLLVQARAC